MWKWMGQQVNRLNWVLFVAMMSLVLVFLAKTKDFADSTYYNENDISTVNTEWRQHSDWGYTHVNIPGQLAMVDQKAVVRRTINREMMQKGGIGFFCPNTFVQAYVNDELVYTNFVNDVDGNRMVVGDEWHYIVLQNNHSRRNELRIEFTSVTGYGEIKIGDIYVGSQQEVFSIALGLDYYKYVIILSLAVLGGFVLLFRFVYRNRIGLHPSIVMLGFGSIFSATAVASISSLISFGYLSSYTLKILGYSSMLLAAVAVGGYLLRFDLSLGRNLLVLLMSLSIAWVLVFASVHLLEYRAIMRWEYTVFGVLIIGLMLYSIFLATYSFAKLNEQLRTLVLSFSQLIALLMMDVMLNVRTGLTGPLFSLVGVVLFFLINSMSEVQATLKQYEWAELTSYYKYLARTDQMTRLRNRISLVEDLKRLNLSKDGLSVISFDVDNLKTVNDNFGHNVGDDMIITASKLIYDVFGSLGECYRISGDEFLCISNADIFVLHNFLFKFKQAIRDMDSHKFYRLRISAGVATFTPDLDRTLEDTMIRADKEMYDDKHKSKDSSDY